MDQSFYCNSINLTTRVGSTSCSNPPSLYLVAGARPLTTLAPARIYFCKIHEEILPILSQPLPACSWHDPMSPLLTHPFGNLKHFFADGGLSKRTDPRRVNSTCRGPLFAWERGNIDPGGNHARARPLRGLLGFDPLIMSLIVHSLSHIRSHRIIPPYNRYDLLRSRTAIAQQCPPVTQCGAQNAVLPMA